MSCLNQNISQSEHQKSSYSNSEEKYVLSLYISGITVKSVNAIRKLREICQDYLDDQYKIKIIDISQNPEIAESEHITAVPTLIKRIPAPLRRFIGDLSDTEKVLVGLNIVPD